MLFDYSFGFGLVWFDQLLFELVWWSNPPLKPEWMGQYCNNILNWWIKKAIKNTVLSWVRWLSVEVNGKTEWEKTKMF